MNLNHDHIQDDSTKDELDCSRDDFTKDELDYVLGVYEKYLADRDPITSLYDELTAIAHKGKTSEEIQEGNPTYDPLEELLNAGFTLNGRQVYNRSVGNAKDLLKALVDRYNGWAESVYEILVNEAAEEYDSALFDFYPLVFDLNLEYKDLIDKIVSTASKHDIESYVKDQIIIDYMHKKSNGFTGSLPFKKPDITWLILTSRTRTEAGLPLSRNLKEFLVNGAARCLDENCDMKEPKKSNPFPLKATNRLSGFTPNINYRVLYLLKKELAKASKTIPQWEHDKGVCEETLVLENFPEKVDENSSWAKARKNVVDTINGWELFNKFAGTQGKNGISVKATIDGYLNRSK